MKGKSPEYFKIFEKKPTIFNEHPVLPRVIILRENYLKVIDKDPIRLFYDHVFDVLLPYDFPSTQT